MAYYLKKPNDNAYVSFPAVSIPAGNDFELHLDFGEIVLNQNWRPIGRDNSFDSRVIKFADSNEFVYTTDTSLPRRIIPLGIIYVERNLYVFKRVSNVVRMFVNGVDQGVSWPDPRAFIPNAFFRHSTASAGDRSALYRVKLFNADGDIIHDWNPSASNGTGSTLIDTVGGNNGTLVNFPTDDSQWVFYGTPTDDVDSSIAAAWPSLAVSVSQSQELPSGTTADIALTWPSLSVSANQSVTVPEYSSTVATTWPSLGVNASQSATAPEYATSVNAVWPSLSVSVSQGQAIPAVDSSVNVTWPALSISVSQAQSIPSLSADISATWPSLTIAASQSQQLPAGAMSVSVTWPSLSVSASQSATVPTTTADISAAWPSLSVSAGIDVSVPVGGASVAVTWPSLAVSVSQSATAPTLSQINVTWPSLAANAEQASTVPEYTATIATTWPSLAVSVIAGEFDYATDPDAKITIYKESRRVTISQPSRKITIVTPSRRIEL
jgi:hypothetical protein